MKKNEIKSNENKSFFRIVSPEKNFLSNFYYGLEAFLTIENKIEFEA